jgi:hypothetical protein
MPTGQSQSKARVARLKERCLAAAPERRTAKIHVRIAPRLMAEVEAERELYAVRPRMTEVTVQLRWEGLAYRRSHRPDPVEQAKRARRRRGEPFVFDLDEPK